MNFLKRKNFYCFVGKGKSLFNLQQNVKEQTQMFLHEMKLKDKILKAVDNICQDHEVNIWKKELQKINEI